MNSFEYTEFKKLILTCIDGVDDADSINGNENLIEYGINSLKIMRLAAGWKKKKIKVTFSKLMEKPTIDSWYELVCGQKTEANQTGLTKADAQSGTTKENEQQTLKKERAEIDYNSKFPLTDVQYAYWIGRQDEQILGGVGCHAYLEFDGKDLNIDKLKTAWKKLILTHPMLHVRFLEDGTQQIMETPYDNEIIFNDYTSLSEPEYKPLLENTKNRISHRKLEVEKGKCIGLEVSLLPDNKHRLHLDLDLLVADVQSMEIILRDFARLYNDETIAEAVSKWNFEEYLKNEIEDENAYEEAKKYWLDRVDEMPMGPALPLAKQMEEIKEFRVNRNLMMLSGDKWTRIKEKAAKYQVTPAIVLLTAYATILERWSANKDFLINIPLFNRRTDIENIEEVVADFTTLLLLEIHGKENKTFEDFMLSIKNQFYTDINYKAYSGVKVQRAMAKKHRGQVGIAPVVFACNLGTPIIDDKFKNSLGEFNFMVSQTPQVWLDFQTYEDEDGLMLAWDVLEELFPENVIKEMFSAFEKLLFDLADKEWNNSFDVLPEVNKKRIEEDMKLNPAKNHYIHTEFLKQAVKKPDGIALIDGINNTTIKYGAMSDIVLKIAEVLKQKGITDSPVAVTIPRGVNQIFAMYGILASGNYYVPVSVGQPLKRRTIIHNRIGIKNVIATKETVNKVQWPENTCIYYLEDILMETENLKVPSTEEYLNNLRECETDGNRPAYIIMTSGSTGEPKGVFISHKGAWNTIEAINKSYDIDERDTAFAISAIDFDLSVYDTFGILGAGGSLVCIPEEEKKNAFCWLELVKKHHVTVWNSVPALLDMLLLAYEEKEQEKLPIRIAMLSGDWINLNLPERLQKATNNSRFIAMGGATEASIWSNYCEVSLTVPDTWKSIPYGRPLENQMYRVVDEFGRDCPDFVKGELWIGGEGVALGYKGDEELTAKKFTEENGIRFYHTGDMGRFWQDGTIEFLGRMDFQVKVGGHRIELGEIEAALEAQNGISKAAVIALGEDRHLAAYMTLEDKENNDLCCKKERSEIELEDIWKKIEVLSEKEDLIKDNSFDSKFTSYINSLVTKALIRILNEIGLKENEKMNQKELLTQAGISENYFGVIDRWTDYLRSQGILKKDGLEIILDKNITEITKTEAYEVSFAHKDRLDKYVETVIKNIRNVLKGSKTALEVYFDEALKISPMEALKTLPNYENTEREYIKQVGNVISLYEKKVNIVELATQSLDVTLKILEENSDRIESYVYLVNSSYFAASAKEALKDYTFVSVEVNGNENIDKYSRELLISFHGLHQCQNIDKNLRRCLGYLQPGAHIIFAELVGDMPIQELSASVLEDGFVHYSDERKETKSPLFSKKQWEDTVKKAGIRRITDIETSSLASENSCVFIAQNASEVFMLDEKVLKDRLSQYLPDYMIPKIMLTIDEFPITANGKIDRKQLAKISPVQSAKKNKRNTLTKTEQMVRSYFVKLFGTEEVGAEDNYFELGGDSLTATKLLSWLRQEQGIGLSIAAIFENPSVEQLANYIDKALEKENENMDSYRKLPKCQGDLENRYEPFPLTDVQYAYWIGRSGLYDLGGVGTHCYFELDMENCDFDRLNSSFNQLVKTHDMMRAIVLPDGNQCILKEVPEYKIQKTEVVTQKDSKDILENVRKEMSHQLIETDKWPLFDIKATKYDEIHTRLHISFDNIIFDGWSMFHLLGQWQKVYKGEVKENREFTFSFRDYVLELEKIKNSSWHEEDEKYWSDRVEDFKSAPELPLIISPNQIDVPAFARREAMIDKASWEKLKLKAKKMGITPSVLLLAAFSEALRMWSKNKEFTLNLTQFNRLPINEEVNSLVGDFTTLTFLEIKNNSENNFINRAKTIQSQLAKDLEHSYFSGIEMQRALTKHAHNQNINFPIVFTSGLGVDQWNEGSWIGDLVYNISQTPQVWLDHQVVERDGALCLFFDYVEALFDKDMITEMFTAYRDLLYALAENDALWSREKMSLIEANISEDRKNANNTFEKYELKTLDGMFLESVRKYGDEFAVIYGDKKLTYKQLYAYADRISQKLETENLKKQEVVGVFIGKCWQQIAGVLGIHFAGGIYLPMDTKNPKNRLEKVIEASGLKLVITTDEYIEKLQDIEGIKVINIDDLWAEAEEIDSSELTDRKSVNELNDLAYIIFTSGSTGVPKGVAITHGGAMNTIADINERYHVTNKDSAIALSNLYFDLSVYDVFGMLAAGGSIVIPPENQLRNPKYWLELIDKYHVTIWNTVPAFMQMLTTYMKKDSPVRENSLRQVLLSGDWIPLNLPGEIKNLFKDVKVAGLGGATEASIWSNTFDIPDEIPKEWRSIPYGKPLKNQRFYVLNDNLMDCPDGVPGMLYIAGDGLAKEYYHDEVLTNEKFFVHQEKQERIYCTGDMGRYMKDGNIEFLGREDAQVKINGYRVELGEIEAAAKKYRNVMDAAAVVVTDEEKIYTALFIVGDEKDYDKEELKDTLKNNLADYMVPEVVGFLENMKLSNNGKVDRKALAALAIDLNKDSADENVKELIQPETETEKKLFEIWKSVLDYGQLSIEDHFFEIGGNSLQAIHLMNAVNENFQSDLGIDKLFEYPTIKALGAYFDSMQ